MPYINLKTNVKIEDPMQMQMDLGSKITLIPNKPYERTMITIEGGKDMFFFGNDEPCAFVETLVNNETDQSQIQLYCDAALTTVSEKLGIPANRIYVTVNAVDNWYSKK